MPWAEKKIGKDGKKRYTGVYRDLRGHNRSAGTFNRRRDAIREAAKAEVRVAEGRGGDPRRGKMNFTTYVDEEWLPNHVMEPSTRQNYTYAIEAHIKPFFGKYKMNEILPSHVREWVTELATKKNLSPANIQKLKNSVLSAIFTTALDDQVVFLHPCKGVKTPPVPVKTLEVVTPAQFDALYHALPTEEDRLLIETDIESGLRWGELTELRVKDLNFTTRVLTVSRVAVEIQPKYHPKGERFLIKPYPKDKEWRRFKLSTQIVRKLKAHVKEKKLKPEDLLFSYRELPLPEIDLKPETLGRTKKNARGKSYAHGTKTAYTLGGCKCEYCRAAFAKYRRERRAVGLDGGPAEGRPVETDGHIPRGWFRVQIWNPAREAAGLPEATPHDLRHAHASWLLSGGADLQVVKERLGHGSIKTTERYLHTLDNADETAIDALKKIRSRQRRKTQRASAKSK
jgi:integrase